MPRAQPGSSGRRCEDVAAEGRLMPVASHSSARAALTIADRRTLRDNRLADCLLPAVLLLPVGALRQNAQEVFGDRSIASGKPRSVLVKGICGVRHVR